MPSPKDVFDCPENHWEFITSPTDDDFEGQCFERKEAGRPDEHGQLSGKTLKSIKRQFVESISAFANINREGGLLVIGVSSSGDIKGINHLSESQLNSITAYNDLLRNQAATIRFLDCQNYDNSPDKILMVFTPYSENGICETLGKNPKAWVRNGKQNIPITEQIRDQIKRDKKIVDFEKAYCCPFDMEDVDDHVLAEFRRVFLEDTSYDLTDEQLLYQAGMIQRDGDGYAFNNAGFLFISKNPQRILPYAYLRLLRFAIPINDNDLESKGLSTLDKKFDGPIAQQIRKIRAFFRDSGFFKTYQIRNPKGGFIDNPEFPFIAIDEAIVNSVAHRDYGVQLPIECAHYLDAFTVENPGPIIQRDQNVPPKFTLEETSLDSMPRNSKLIEWLKLIRNEDGAAFVRAISEGTKRMSKEMADANLPSPEYNINQIGTKVTLYNNVIKREAALKNESKLLHSTEFTNFFRVDLISEQDKKIGLKGLRDRRNEIMNCFRDSLESKGWYIDRFKFGRIIAHRKGVSVPLPQPVSRLIGFYPAYSFQFREYIGNLYLVIDYTLSVRNIQTVRDLLKHVAMEELSERMAVGKYKGWHRGRIISTDHEFTKIYLFSYDSEVQLSSDQVYPDLPISFIKKYLTDNQIAFDISKEIKKSSLSFEPGAGRTRNEKTLAIVQQLVDNVFPFSFEGMRVFLRSDPEYLYRNEKKGFFHVRTLSEPVVEFSRHRESPNIRNGITKFGSYEDSRKTIELIPICSNKLRKNLSSLIERLKTGKFKYAGAERTFSTKLTYSSIVTVHSANDIFSECNRLLDEHPEWVEDDNLNRLFLVHTPEAGYSLDDENSPYYKVKRFLLESGIPCQMVDTPTILNPDWKDLNLTLNIIAKCGVTPWVLPNRIPDADFFIGLSYTQNRKKGAKKLLGYATVFNEFGRWEFYTGNTNVFSYKHRTRYFSKLTKQTMKRLTLSDSPTIYFHYSARFSKDDRKSILEAARSVKPNGTYSFVWINPHHNIRLYDNRAETDGSLRRGSYVVTTPNQILLSTTGYNPFRKTLGTPKPLEINIRTEKPDGSMESNPDLKALAVQILNLTKLNWASTDSVSGEPITTKYAGDIAYLTDAFLRQSDSFNLNSVLERTPWFL